MCNRTSENNVNFHQHGVMTPIYKKTQCGCKEQMWQVGSAPGSAGLGRWGGAGGDSHSSSYISSGTCSLGELGQLSDFALLASVRQGMGQACPRLLPEE